MTAQNKYEVTGNLRENSLAELFLEITESKLTGSIRLIIDKEKIIIYLVKGEVIYAVSNSRRHRLFELLLREQKIFKAQLADIENFVNDMELGKTLIEKHFITNEDLHNTFKKQVKGIVRYSLSLTEGFWTFNPLIRIKKGIDYQINIRQMLLDYAKSLTPEDIFSRFDWENETFAINSNPPTDLNLQSQEGFLLSRFETLSLGINELQMISGLPDKITMQIVYSLWLSGFIFRENWEPILSDEYKVNTLLADFEVKKVAKTPEKVEAESSEEVQEDPLIEEEIVEEEIDEETLLNEYLERVENSNNFYEILGLSPDAETAEIKKTYFGFAKKYHPDHFHSQTENNLNQRMQNAFTQIAHAYDTLKKEESRQVYDFKMRKELAQSEKIKNMKGTHDQVEAELKAEQAEKIFERGYEFLTEDEFQKAAPLLARAVQLDKNNAKYRAYYGKVLSLDEKQSHKAEAELREAVRLDENNPTYRLILAEFYIQINLLKRAEGELKRLVEKFPNEKEAQALLDSLQEK